MPSVSSYREEVIRKLEEKNRILTEALSAIRAVSSGEQAMEGRKTDRLWHAGHRQILDLIDKAGRDIKALEPVDRDNPDAWEASDSPSGPKA